MTEQETYAQQASKGYPVCTHPACPLSTQCLRRLAADHAPATLAHYTSINHNAPDVGTRQCPHHRPIRKVRIAYGMLHTFSDDMPRRVHPGVRKAVIDQTNRQYYNEYRNGTRPIPPALQQKIIRAFRDNGWNGDVRFDTYTEAYDW